jgi:NAD(P)-dependent dehydrogenase (short-subunit alcohol dehydrogenase family)
MTTVLITGASSGLGAHIAHQIASWSPLDDEVEIIDWSREKGIDISDQWSVAEVAALLDQKKVDILVNCAGVNEIRTIDKLTVQGWDQVLNVNARGIFLVTKDLLENLRGGTVLNIISNASNVPMTGSLAYNASKGAAKIMTLQMHRELFKSHQITVFGISPNKLSGTGMSEYIDKRVCEGERMDTLKKLALIS